MLEEGIAFNVRERETKTPVPQRGANVRDTDAGKPPRPRQAGRTEQSALPAAAHNHMEPDRTWSPTISANRGQVHQPASILNQEVLAGLILKFQAILSNADAHLRLQLRCNPERHEGGAYTSFP